MVKTTDKFICTSNLLYAETRHRVFKIRQWKYLFGKVFWFPRRCKSHTLPLLCSLSLFKAVLVFCCCINITFFQRIGDVLPKVPAWWRRSTSDRVRTLLPQPSAWLDNSTARGRLMPRSPCHFCKSHRRVMVHRLEYSPHLWTRFSDLLNSQCFAMQVNFPNSFCSCSWPFTTWAFFSKQMDLFLSFPVRILYWWSTPKWHAFILRLFAVKFLNYKGMLAKSQEYIILGHWLFPPGY